MRRDASPEVLDFFADLVGTVNQRLNAFQVASAILLALTFIGAMSSNPSELVSDVFVVITQGRQD